jgi:hypothetical protein
MRKKTPDTSKLTRANAAPYTLRKTEPSATNFIVAKDKGDKKVEAKVDVKTLVEGDGKIDAKFDDVKSGPVTVEPTDGAPKPGDGPKSATHNEAPTEPPRARAETVGMPVVAPVGAPPEMPASEPAPAPAPASAKTVEDPTTMPSAKNVPAGNPTDPALPPGHVPPGDSRSFRRGDEFALVYRQGTCVITRFGTIGQRGQWRVVEYPTSASASNSYAKECSRFIAEGFSDYRG